MNKWLAARNILVVRMDNMGDVVMLGPALRAIKATSPYARITLLASPAGSMAAQLLPWIDDVITWRAIWQDVGNKMPQDPQRELELVQILAERRFDAALIFTSFRQTPHTPGYVCYLADIPLRAGESTEFAGSTLTTELQGSPTEMHQAERNLRLVEQLGFVASLRQLAITLSEHDCAYATQLLQNLSIDTTRSFLLLHPGATAEARRYPIERFAQVVALLTQRGWQVVVTGVEGEAEMLSYIRAEAPQARYLVGQTTISTYAALVEQATLVLCNNTLALHLADACVTPVVVLYSGTDYEEQWRPRSTPARLLRRPTSCSPCYLFTCPIKLPCLDIPAYEVVCAIEDLISSTGQKEVGALL